MDRQAPNLLPVGQLNAEQTARAAAVLNAALQAVEPRRAVRQALGQMPAEIARGGRVRLVAVGKAAVAMARGALDVLGDQIDDGVLITKAGALPPANDPLPADIRVLTGGHPLPTADSVASTRALLEFAAGGREDDLVLCLVSGGGSALMTMPAPGVELADLQALTSLLLACGATIQEINCLRKHLDVVKGGGLARWLAPAQVTALILSDVVGSPLEVIASGPTVADSSTYADALEVLRRYALLERAPAAILAALQRGRNGQLPETLKPGHSVLAGVHNHLILSNRHAAEAGLRAAQAQGFHTLLLSTYLQGEASQAGALLAAILREIEASGQPLPRPACIVAGGETTVTLRGGGKGGRNLELALGALAALDGVPDAALITLATDGEDGPTDAAGALVTGNTAQSAWQAGLVPADALRMNDSYPFFARLGALLRTGPTGTNVNDLVFLFAF